MKLSEMTTRQAAAALVDLAVPVEEISSHPAFLRCMDSFSNMTQKDAKDQASARGLRMILDLLPVLLKDCYQSTISILSVLTGKSVEQIDNQSVFQTIRDVRDSWDADLKSFFS